MQDAATAYTADRRALSPAEPVYRRSDADAATAWVLSFLLSHVSLLLLGLCDH